MQFKGNQKYLLFGVVYIDAHFALIKYFSAHIFPLLYFSFSIIYKIR